jgi:hypothetical protein
MVLAWTGQVDRAFQLLDQLAGREYFISLNYGSFLREPSRHDPCYSTILAKLKPRGYAVSGKQF